MHRKSHFYLFCPLKYKKSGFKKNVPYCPDCSNCRKLIICLLDEFCSRYVSVLFISEDAIHANTDTVSKLRALR